MLIIMRYISYVIFMISMIYYKYLEVKITSQQWEEFIIFFDVRRWFVITKQIKDNKWILLSESQINDSKKSTILSTKDFVKFMRKMHSYQYNNNKE